MKSGDAATLGGKGVNEFVTIDQLRTQVATEVASQALTAEAVQARPMTTITNPTGSGATGYLPIWTAASKLGDSAIYQTGSGSSARVGLGTTTPASTLDVNGQATIRGGLVMQSASAKSTASVNFPIFDLVASSYSSTAAAAVPQRFRWQVIASGNDTSSPSATLNLLASSTGSTPAETGLSINGKGIIHFATGQTFPGGTGGYGAGAAADFNSLTLPETTNSTTGVIDFGGSPFISDYYANIFIGPSAGNFKGTGSYNSVLGMSALSANTTGEDSVGVGTEALTSNTTGSYNTGIGFEALVNIAMTASTHGYGHLIFTGKADGVHDVRNARRPHDHRWSAVDHAVPHLPHPAILLIVACEELALHGSS